MLKNTYKNLSTKVFNQNTFETFLFKEFIFYKKLYHTIPSPCLSKSELSNWVLQRADVINECVTRICVCVCDVAVGRRLLYSSRLVGMMHQKKKGKEAIETIEEPSRQAPHRRLFLFVFLLPCCPAVLLDR